MMPMWRDQVKPLGSTLLLTCQVTGDQQVDYNLEWTAQTDGVVRNIDSATGRFVFLPRAEPSRVTVVTVPVTKLLEVGRVP